MHKTVKRLELERNTILELQTNGEQTIESLAAKLETGYYTARSVIHDLFQEQKVKIVGQEGRTRIYGLSDSERIKDTIPYLTNLIARTQHKVVGLLASVGHEDEMASVEASKRIPELVTRLLHAANNASHGFPVGKELDEIRTDMQNQYLVLKNASNIYEQILQDPRFWTPKYLKEFVEDPDYNYPDIVKAMEYYG